MSSPRSLPGAPYRAALVLLALAVLWLPHGLRAQSPAPEKDRDTAVLAGGCFWCVESDFDHVKGVVETVSGYIGGTTADPTYKQVTAGGTGHREAVAITYDPSVVSYEALLEVFWRSVDPTDGGGQFCDRGHSYTTAIFPRSEAQAKAAQESKQRLQESGVLKQPVATEVVDGGVFYPAEGYHQNYHDENPLRYRLYRLGCGRDARLKELWGDDAMKGIEKR